MTKTRKSKPLARQLGAGEFKAQCLALMDRVRERGEEYVITKRGEPVAKLVPVAPPGPAGSPFGWMHGSATTHGDIVGPLDVPWDALSEDDD